MTTTTNAWTALLPHAPESVQIERAVRATTTNAWTALLPHAPESVQIERAVRAKIAAKRAAR